MDTGYTEIEHTADWALKVWAPDLPKLLETAARGMYALSHTVLASGPREPLHFELPFFDAETLLVDFLSELLFLGEDQGLAVDNLHLALDGAQLTVQAATAPIHSQAKEIKAVTYHRLAVRSTVRGLTVQIVFDV